MGVADNGRKNRSIRRIWINETPLVKLVNMTNNEEAHRVFDNYADYQYQVNSENMSDLLKLGIELDHNSTKESINLKMFEHE